MRRRHDYRSGKTKHAERQRSSSADSPRKHGEHKPQPALFYVGNLDKEQLPHTRGTEHPYWRSTQPRYASSVLPELQMTTSFAQATSLVIQLEAFYDFDHRNPYKKRTIKPTTPKQKRSIYGMLPYHLLDTTQEKPRFLSVEDLQAASENPEGNELKRIILTKYNDSAAKTLFTLIEEAQKLNVSVYVMSGLPSNNASRFLLQYAALRAGRIESYEDVKTSPLLQGLDLTQCEHFALTPPRRGASGYVAKWADSPTNVDLDHAYSRGAVPQPARVFEEIHTIDLRRQKSLTRQHAETKARERFLQAEEEAGDAFKAALAAAEDSRAGAGAGSGVATTNLDPGSLSPLRLHLMPDSGDEDSSSGLIEGSLVFDSSTPGSSRDEGRNVSFTNISGDHISPSVRLRLTGGGSASSSFLPSQLDLSLDDDGTPASHDHSVNPYSSPLQPGRMPSPAVVSALGSVYSDAQSAVTSESTEAISPEHDSFGAADPFEVRDVVARTPEPDSNHSVEARSFEESVSLPLPPSPASMSTGGQSDRSRSSLSPSPGHASFATPQSLPSATHAFSPSPTPDAHGESEEISKSSAPPASSPLLTSSNTTPAPAPVTSTPSKSGTGAKKTVRFATPPSADAPKSPSVSPRPAATPYRPRPVPAAHASESPTTVKSSLASGVKPSPSTDGVMAVDTHASSQPEEPIAPVFRVSRKPRRTHRSTADARGNHRASALGVARPSSSQRTAAKSSRVARRAGANSHSGTSSIVHQSYPGPTAGDKTLQSNSQRKSTRWYETYWFSGMCAFLGTLSLAMNLGFEQISSFAHSGFALKLSLAHPAYLYTGAALLWLASISILARCMNSKDEVTAPQPRSNDRHTSSLTFSTGARAAHRSRLAKGLHRSHPATSRSTRAEQRRTFSNGRT